MPDKFFKVDVKSLKEFSSVDLNVNVFDRKKSLFFSTSIPIEANFAPLVTPYLSFIEEDKSPFTLQTVNASKNWDGVLEYSTDTKSWSVWDGTELNSSQDGQLYLRGTKNSKISGKLWDGYFVLTDGKKIQCLGNIENLLDYQAVARGEHPVMAKLCFACLFLNCASLTTAPELPATLLSERCYITLFYGCSSLKKAPENLPATTLTDHCYQSMFFGCDFGGSLHFPASVQSEQDAISTMCIPSTVTIVYDL